MIQTIDRLDDPRIASYARVGDPAWLHDRGLFVAEGRLVVRRLFELQRYAVESVLVAPAALQSLRDALPEAATVYVAEQHVLNSITGINFHRGCLALAHRPDVDDVVSPFSGGVDRVVSPFRGVSPGHHLIALEGIGNPDNVGGIFRNAAAFGVDAVLLDPASGDPLYRKAIRTSMGAALSLPFVRLEPWPDALKELADQGFRVLALTPRAGATTLDEIAQRPPDRWVLLAGAEGPGLSDAALATAEVHIRIPTTAAIDSLNVTVAVGIALSRLFQLAYPAASNSGAIRGESGTANAERRS